MRFLESRFYFCLFLFVFHFGIAQEKVLEFNTDYPTGPALIDNSFTLVNETTNDFTVFLTNKSNLSAFNFNESLEFKGWLSSRKLLNKYKIPLGGTVKDKKYSLFYTNSNKSKFALISFDFKSNWSLATEIDLNLKKEIYLSQFIFENTFHILTTTYRDNVLYIYSFDSTGGYYKKTIDLSNNDFFGAADYPTRLKSTLALDIHNNTLTNIVSVQKDIPYSLDSMVSKIKLYLTGDSIHLVSDINHEFTQIISHDLKTGATKVDQFYQANVEYAPTNSFLTTDCLFQVAVNPKEMVFQVTDLKTKKVLKKHHVTKNDELYLANGPIRQRGGRYKQYRELEKTSQFLRKLGNGNPAIYVNLINDQFEINIGSVDEIDNGLISAVAYMNPFTAIASIGALTLYVNPVALALIQASNSKAVYINNVLDKDFVPTNQKEKENIFYIIQDFIEKEDIKRFTASDVFKYKEHYLFGMLDKKSKKYILRKFTEK